MTQHSLFASPAYDVQPGDIYALGRHRLMCADATDKGEVARLFAGDKPTMVVTSPPYAKQRDYDRPIACWDTMMMGGFNGHAFADNVQMLINLGPVHANNEICFYYQPWLEAMKASGWRIYSQYIWDKKMPVAGNFKGRLRPGHEFVFHVNKVTTEINKTEPCIYAGRTQTKGRQGIKDRKGNPRKRAARPVGKLKAPSSIFRHLPVLRGESVGVPAQMPIGLASLMIASWKKENCIAYDPFAGSGTTIHAAEAEGVTGLGCEISPAYVAIALVRWNKAHPDTPARKIASAP